MSQAALFDPHPVSDLTHVLMPNMAYACGGNIVTKGGHFVFNPVRDRQRVTCPECREHDPAALSAEIDRQQGIER